MNSNYLLRSLQQLERRNGVLQDSASNNVIWVPGWVFASNHSLVSGRQTANGQVVDLQTFRELRYNQTCRADCVSGQGQHAL